MNTHHDIAGSLSLSLFRRNRRIPAGYLPGFCFLFRGMRISASGGSVVWPFRTICMRQRSEVALTTFGGGAGVGHDENTEGPGGLPLNTNERGLVYCVQATGRPSSTARREARNASLETVLHNPLSTDRRDEAGYHLCGRVCRHPGSDALLGAAPADLVSGNVVTLFYLAVFAVTLAFVCCRGPFAAVGITRHRWVVGAPVGVLIADWDCLAP